MIGEKVWVPDDVLIWKLSTICGLPNGGNLEIEDEKGKKILAKSMCHEIDSSHLDDSCTNICSLLKIHEAPLLDLLRRRFISDLFYSYAGDILISFNPYKNMTAAYGQASAYLNLDENQSPEVERLPPHVFAIASNALRSLVHNSSMMHTKKDSKMHVNQSVLVSGESGAGKTEASKLVMDFLIQANNSLNVGGDPTASDSRLLDTGESIKNILMKSSVIYEAMGNSKTVRNDNSSRFGKYIKLEYSRDSVLLSAYTETFLLEQARLVSVGQGERNYHIFYRLIRGLQRFDGDLASRLQLEKVDHFNILLEGECTVIGSEENDVEEFSALVDAMQIIGCSKVEIAKLWELMSVILHLGNLTFSLGTEDDGKVDIASAIMSLSSMAAFLGITEADFLRSLTIQRMGASNRSSVHFKVLTPESAKNNSFALIKWLYRSCFSWIVRKVNSAYGAVSKSTDGASVAKFIGILDIFGFEILNRNSFEQLCINFTNERMHQQFNHHVFVLEQTEYEAEAINWSSVHFRNNQQVIDLISKKPTGLFMILEEHCVLNLNRKPDDEKLLQAFDQAHQRTSECYDTGRFGRTGFVVKHFAGDVSYAIDGFLSKNNDSIQDDLVDTMSTSTCTFLQCCMGKEVQPGDLGYIPTGQEINVEASDTPSQAEVVAGSKFSISQERGARVASQRRKSSTATATVSFRFRNQLNMLLETLGKTQFHYVKCIKPNTVKKCSEFDADLVMQQLRYSGILELVRIKQAGYPARLTFENFYSRFRVFGTVDRWPFANRCSGDQLRQYCIQIAEKVLPPPFDYQVGKTKIFLKDNCMTTLNRAANQLFAHYATKMTSVFRAFSCAWKYRLIQWAIVALQARARQRPVRQMYVSFQRTLRLLTRVQALVRMRIAVKKFRRLLAVIKLQSFARMSVSRRKFWKLLDEIARRKASTKLQSLARMRNQRRKFLKTLRDIAEKKSSTTLQAFVRMKFERRKFLKTRSDIAECKASTKLQSVARMRSARRKYVKTLRDIEENKALTKLQAFARMNNERRKYRKALLQNIEEGKASTRLQAFVRMRQERAKYLQKLADKAAEEKAAVEEAARIKYFEEQRRLQEEAVARVIAEAKEQAEAEARLKAEAEAKEQAEAEARLKAEAEAKEQAEAEARLKAEAEAKEMVEREAHLKAEAEAKEMAEAEARLKAEVEAKGKAETEARLRAKAEAEAEVKEKAVAGAREKAEVEARTHAEASVVVIADGAASHKSSEQKLGDEDPPATDDADVAKGGSAVEAVTAVADTAVAITDAAVAAATVITSSVVPSSARVDGQVPAIAPATATAAATTAATVVLSAQAAEITEIVEPAVASTDSLQLASGRTAAVNIRSATAPTETFVAPGATLVAPTQQPTEAAATVPSDHSASAADESTLHDGDEQDVGSRTSRVVADRHDQHEQLQQESAEKQNTGEFDEEDDDDGAYALNVAMGHLPSGAIEPQPKPEEKHRQSTAAVKMFAMLGTANETSGQVDITSQTASPASVASPLPLSPFSLSPAGVSGFNGTTAKARREDELMSPEGSSAGRLTRSTQGGLGEMLSPEVPFDKTSRAQSSSTIKAEVDLVVHNEGFSDQRQLAQTDSVAASTEAASKEIFDDVQPIPKEEETKKLIEPNQLVPKEPFDPTSIPHNPAAARIVTRTGRRFLRNSRYLRRLEAVQAACEAGDLDPVLGTLRARPADLRGLRRLDEEAYCEVIRSAIRYSHVQLLRDLKLTRVDVQAVDNKGNNLFHFAAANAPRILVMRMLASCVAVSTCSSYAGSNTQGATDPARKAPIASSADSANKPLKSGFVMKLTRKDIWRVRYVVLTPRELRYSGMTNVLNASDVFHLDKHHMTFSRRDDIVGHVISINMSSGKKSVSKKSDSITLRLSSEEELRDWLRCLSLCGSMENFRPTSSEPIFLVDFNMLDIVLSQANRLGDNLLHTLVRNMSVETATAEDLQAVIRVAAWLVSYGCPLNGRDSLGKTPLMVAVEVGNDALARCFRVLGADISLKDNSGRSVLEYRHENISKLMIVRSEKSSQFRRLPAPLKAFGCTYVSFFFEALQTEATDSNSSGRRDSPRSAAAAAATTTRESINFAAAMPTLSVCVYNDKQEQMEGTQEFTGPVIAELGHAWFGCMWHMQTPIEQLPRGSCIVVQLSVESRRSSGRGGSAGVREVGWALHKLDRQTINTGAVTLNFIEGETFASPPLTRARVALVANLILSRNTPKPARLSTAPGSSSAASSAASSRGKGSPPKERKPPEMQDRYSASPLKYESKYEEVEPMVNPLKSPRGSVSMKESATSAALGDEGANPFKSPRGSVSMREPFSAAGAGVGGEVRANPLKSSRSSFGSRENLSLSLSGSVEGQGIGWRRDESGEAGSSSPRLSAQYSSKNVKQLLSPTISRRRSSFFQDDNAEVGSDKERERARERERERERERGSPGSTGSAGSPQSAEIQELTRRICEQDSKISELVNLVKTQLGLSPPPRAPMTPPEYATPMHGYGYPPHPSSSHASASSIHGSYGGYAGTGSSSQEGNSPSYRSPGDVSTSSSISRGSNQRGNNSFMSSSYNHRVDYPAAAQQSPESISYEGNPTSQLSWSVPEPRPATTPAATPLVDKGSSGPNGPSDPSGLALAQRRLELFSRLTRSVQTNDLTAMAAALEEADTLGLEGSDIEQARSLYNMRVTMASRAPLSQALAAASVATPAKINEDTQPPPQQQQQQQQPEEGVTLQVPAAAAAVTPEPTLLAELMRKTQQQELKIAELMALMSDPSFSPRRRVEE